MFSSLNELLKLPDKPRLNPGELKKAKHHMMDLRGRGFTSREISKLCRGRWSEATVKKYTRGAEVKSTSEKDHVLEMITELTQADKTIQDIIDYQSFNKLLEQQNVRFEALTGFYLSTITKEPNLPQFIRLFDELQISRRSLEQLNRGLDRIERLLNQGLTEENMLQILQTSKKYGGFEKTMQAFAEYGNLQELQQINDQAVQDLEQLNQKTNDLLNRNTQLETQNKVLGAYADTAQALMKYEYDIASLVALRNLANKYGGPVALFDAIGEYQSVEAIKQTRANLVETIKLLEEKRIQKEAELAASEEYIEHANRLIGKIEDEHRKSLSAQIIIELMTDPETLEIEASRFKRVALNFLLGLKQYGDRTDLSGWNNLRYTVATLIEGLSREV